MRRNVRHDIPNNGNFWSRYELKYLISESKGAEIAQFVRPYMRPDYYCELQPSGSYPIATLYLDSENLHLCRQSMRGCKNRFKLRIRSYTDESDYPCFFEIKRRANAIIIKDRAKVMPHDVATLLSELSLPAQNLDGDEDTLSQFQLYMASLGARPIVRTHYYRQAFESIVDKKVRLTLDRNISYNVTSTAKVGLDGHGWYRLPTNSVVLEIKFTGRYPAWLSRMVKYFHLRQRSVSKYVHSIKRASSQGLLYVGGGYKMFARK